MPTQDRARLHVGHGSQGRLVLERTLAAPTVSATRPRQGCRRGMRSHKNEGRADSAGVLVQGLTRSPGSFGWRLVDQQHQAGAAAGAFRALGEQRQRHRGCTQASGDRVRIGRHTPGCASSHPVARRSSACARTSRTSRLLRASPQPCKRKENGRSLSQGDFRRHPRNRWRPAYPLRFIPGNPPAPLACASRSQASRPSQRGFPRRRTAPNSPGAVSTAAVG